MPSTETTAHVVAVVLAFLLLGAAETLGVGVGTGPAGIAALVGYNGLIFGGGQLYLELRGIEGVLSPAARRRYLLLLATLLGILAAALATPALQLGPVPLDLLLFGLALVAIAVYLAVEVPAGYRAFGMDSNSE